MSGRTLFEGSSPVSQSVEAVKALLSCVGRESDPLPEFVELSGGVRLTLSGKKDVYYTTTPANCSCPAATYHPGQPCKHRRDLLAGAGVEASRQQAREYQARQREMRERAKVQAIPVPISVPVAEGESLMPRGGFRPVMPEDEREASSSPLSAIDCHDTTDKEAAYWSIKEDKIMWPVEA